MRHRGSVPILLKDELQPDLDLPGVVGGVGDLTEGAIVGVGVGGPETGMVEGVQELDPELEAGCFMDAEILDGGNIPVVAGIGSQAAEAQGPGAPLVGGVGRCRRVFEEAGLGIEPAVDGFFPGADIFEIPGVERIAGRPAERRSGLVHVNRLYLPPPQDGILPTFD